jgi:hypothetical protein
MSNHVEYIGLITHSFKGLSRVSWRYEELYIEAQPILIQDRTDCPQLFAVFLSSIGLMHEYLLTFRFCNNSTAHKAN